MVCSQQPPVFWRLERVMAHLRRDTRRASARFPALRAGHAWSTFRIRLLRGGCGASGRDARLVDSLAFPPTSRDLSGLFVVFLRENARAAALDSLTRDFLVKRKARYFFYCRPTSRQVGALRACWLMLPGMVRERHRRRCCSRGHLNRAGGAGAVVFRTGPCLFFLGADHVRYAHHVHTS